jgi:hypothetical protein
LRPILPLSIVDQWKIVLSRNNHKKNSVKYGKTEINKAASQFALISSNLMDSPAHINTIVKAIYLISEVGDGYRTRLPLKISDYYI